MTPCGRRSRLLPGLAGSQGGERRGPAPARAPLSSPHPQSREEEEEPPFDLKGELLSEPPGASAKSEAWNGIRGFLIPFNLLLSRPCVCLALQSPAVMGSQGHPVALAGGLGSAGVIVGREDLRGLLQPK